MEKSDVFAAIAAQQPKERNAIWMVGEQLKDMVRAEPELADLLLEDLQSPAMTLAEAEKKIAERAQKNRQGNCGIVTPREADEILRGFYGLPTGTGVAPSSIQEEEPRQPAAAEPSGTPIPTKSNTETKILDIFDFL